MLTLYITSISKKPPASDDCKYVHHLDKAGGLFVVQAVEALGSRLLKIWRIYRAYVPTTQTSA